MRLVFLLLAICLIIGSAAASKLCDDLCASYQKHCKTFEEEEG
jgi:hypothetical protein